MDFQDSLFWSGEDQQQQRQKSLGQFIFGERYTESLGQAVDISGDGHRLVASSGEYRFLRARVFDFEGEVWNEKEWDGIHAPAGAKEGNGPGLSLYKDGKVLVISYPYSDSRDGVYNAADLVTLLLEQWSFD
jgi:hypothetical protein